MRRLIINADDFGLTSGVNRAIMEASGGGVVTSATLMANSRAFAEAVELAKKVPNLKIGCHVIFLGGEPLSPGLHSLTDGDGKLKNNLKDFALAAIRNRLSANEIQREAEAQIRKLQSAGITVTHVDTHKHTHVFPAVLRPLLKAAKTCGIRVVRSPFEPLRAWPVKMLLAQPRLWGRGFQVALFRKFQSAFRQIVEQEGFHTTNGTIGILATGALDQNLLLATINALPEGTWELVCHPGYMDADLAAAGTRLLDSRRVELDALTSKRTRDAILSRGIDLISYEELTNDIAASALRSPSQLSS